MLDGVILLWFILTAASVLFVALDIRNTPESPVLKWGFILVTAYTGPIGAFLYVLGCREPLPGTHERYVAARWRQVLGSTMHCVAGDGVGILAGAVIAAVIGLSGWLDVLLEYLLGFGFGWMIFQALFMRDMAGGSYTKALRATFTSELLSMNLLMAGMVPTMIAIRTAVPEAESPLAPEFWFAMSMALLVGALCAYPMNWWLVSHHLKHGMMTVRPSVAAGTGTAMEGMRHEAAGGHAGHAMAGNAQARRRSAPCRRPHGPRFVRRAGGGTGARRGDRIDRVRPPGAGDQTARTLA
jgi:Domain of unknown function (DUF4396)